MKVAVRKVPPPKPRLSSRACADAETPEVLDDEDSPERPYEIVLSRAEPQALDVRKFPVEKIPTAVARCFRDLKKVKKEVDKAIESAKKASRRAQKASETETTKWFGLKVNPEAISDVQEAISELAGAVEEHPKLMKRLAQYQENLARAVGFLLGLGLLGLAQNRTVVARVKKELENASKEEIDELARAELQNCLDQLKRQEDQQVRLEKLSRGVETNRKKGQERDKLIQENRERGFERDKKIERLNRQMRVVAGRHWGFYLFEVLSVIAFLMATAVFIKIFFFN